MSPAIATELRVNPFLHIDAERIYNPLTDRALTPLDAEYQSVRRAINGGDPEASLLDGGWLVRGDVSTSYRLKIVSLETLTTCNQKCYFCPVSIAPRADYTMPTEFFEQVVNQLTDYRKTIESVFLQSYNEPTLDKRFLDQCRTLRRRPSGCGAEQRIGIDAGQGRRSHRGGPAALSLHQPLDPRS